MGGLRRELADRLLPPLRLGESADDVLDEDDRAVDDEPEVDGAEAHEVRGDARLDHSREGEEHRERDRRGDDQPRADVAEEEEEDGDDEDAPLEEIRLHGADDAPHERRPVVIRDDLHPFRERRLELLDRLAGPGGDVEGVLARQHLDEADDRLPAAVLRRDADPHHRALAHLRDAPDGHGSSVLVGLQDDLLDVGHRPDEPLAPHDVLLAVVLDVPAPGVGVPALHRLEDLAERKAMRPKAGRVDEDLVLLREAAPRVHLGDTGDGAQARRDHPVEDRPALHGRDPLAFDRELEDVT